MSKTYGSKTNIVKELETIINCQFEANSITPQFPETVKNLGEKDICKVPCSNRKDFREEKTFTIDCDDCKDMDDAVSVATLINGVIGDRYSFKVEVSNYKNELIVSQAQKLAA